MPRLFFLFSSRIKTTSSPSLSQANHQPPSTEVRRTRPPPTAVITSPPAKSLATTSPPANSHSPLRQTPRRQYQFRILKVILSGLETNSLKVDQTKKAIYKMDIYKDLKVSYLVFILVVLLVIPRKKLLIVLSNIGYCKDELCHGLYNKYKHMWLQDREKDEEYADIQDLVASFSRLEEKILEYYAYAKASFIRIAAANYLLDSGVQWGGAPAVKGIRDVTLELLHCLVAVHAEVFSGAKPLLEKILGILVEGLIDTFLSLFHEHKAKDLKLFDANGFCQLMLELEYFETVLHTYFSPEAHEALKSLQGLLLEKACESSSEPNENPGHHRRPTRGSEDAMADEKQQVPSVSPDDLLAQAHQFITELLEGELERTRLNIVCFMEASLQPNSVPASLKTAYSSFQGPVASPNYRKQQSGSPGFSRRRR